MTSKFHTGPNTRQAATPGVTRRDFMKATATVTLGASVLGGASAIAAEDEEVVVLGWTSYITPEIVAIMKKEGLNVRGVPASTDADMFTKVKAGGAGSYDIVFANCGWSPTYYKSDLIEAFDVKEIAGWEQLWPVFREDTSFPYVLEPNKVLLFPNMWDSFGLIWNTAECQPKEPYSWQTLWDERIPKGKVIMRDGPDDFLAISGLALGVPRDEIYAMSGEKLREVAKHLAGLKPFQIAPGDEIFIDSLRTGKAWTGETSSLALAARLNRMEGKELAKAVIPVEGSLGWVDGPMLIKGARNRTASLKFIALWNGTEIQDYLYQTYGFPQCNKAATERTLAKGGEGAQQLLDRGADTPDAAKKLLFVGPPNNPGEWAQAYAEVVGG
jgi:spermidine/putrescine transport system substrate-binding protein